MPQESRCRDIGVSLLGGDAQYEPSLHGFLCGQAHCSGGGAPVSCARPGGTDDGPMGRLGWCLFHQQDQTGRDLACASSPVSCSGV